MPAIPAKLLNKPFRFYFRRHWRSVAVGLTCLLITNSFETSIPLLVGRTIDKIIDRAPFANVAETVALILLFTAVLSTTRYMWRVFWGRFHHRVAEDLRNRLFDKYTELTPSFFRLHKVGQMVTLVAHDVNSFRMGIGPGMLVLVDGIFYSCLILPRMASISLPLTLKTLALMPFVPFLVRALINRYHKAYHDRQDRFSEMSGSAQELISGIRVVKSFAQEDNQTRVFNRYSTRFQGACDTVARWDSFFPPLLQLPVTFGSVALMIVGAPEVMRGAITLGSFFAFYQYVQRMIWPMEAIGVSVGQIQEGRASFARIKAVLESVPDIQDTGTVDVDRFEVLEVRDLSFTYPGQTMSALSNVSFSVRAGESLGVVGETGSGKTTLIELLSRQYPATPNTIFINGVAIESIRLASLRRLIGVVPQEAFLFTREVGENLAFSRDEWGFDEVHSAADSVRLHDEIEQWQGGYHAMVGERGVNLSGGQKQRMALARALMKDASLILLDDSLSAVDARTEQVIRDRLRSLASSIVVSHRLASVAGANQILVLQDGRVEAIGPHARMLETSPTYRRLNELQSNGRAEGLLV